MRVALGRLIQDSGEVELQFTGTAQCLVLI